MRYRQNPPKKVLQTLNSLRGKKCIITFHSLADLDACACAIALKDYLGKNAKIAMQDRANSQAKRVLADYMPSFEKFEKAIQNFPNSKIIVVDCSDPSLLPKLGGRQIDVLIDHHAIQKSSVGANCSWIDPEASAASQMLSKIIKRPPADIAEILILGIISDSANLAHADFEAFNQLAYLLGHAQKDFDSLRTSLQVPKSTQSKLEVLRGISNAHVQEKGGLICAISKVNSHESHVAQSLVEAGADCAFAGAGKKDLCMISARMRPVHISNIDLPSLMEKIGKFIGGSGGGHPAAAGATGNKGDKCTPALKKAREYFFSHSTAKIKI